MLGVGRAPVGDRITAVHKVPVADRMLTPLRMPGGRIYEDIFETRNHPDVVQPASLGPYRPVAGPGGPGHALYTYPDRARPVQLYSPELLCGAAITEKYPAAGDPA